MSHSLKLEDVSTCSDGATTNEAYRIRAWVSDNQTGRMRIVNTGTIDPFQLLWGKKVMSYLGFKGTHPCVVPKLLKEGLPRRYDQTMKSTVVVAGMASRLEAAVAPSGVLCGKSAVLILPNEGICPYALCALLNTKAYTELYRGIFSMRGMSPQSLNIGPKQIRRMPIPNSLCLAPYTNNLNQHVLDYPILSNSGELSALGQKLHSGLSSESTDRLLQHLERYVRHFLNTSAL